MYAVKMTKLHSANINSLEEGVSHTKEQIRLTYDAQEQIVDYLQQLSNIGNPTVAATRKQSPKALQDEGLGMARLRGSG